VSAFAPDGSITAWGSPYFGGTGAPTDSGYTKIYSNAYAFAALKADGSIKAWGDSNSGGANALTVGVFVAPYFELPHAMIEPSCVRTAKALLLE
jgi:hypothetical protein